MSGFMEIKVAKICCNIQYKSYTMNKELKSQFFLERLWVSLFWFMYLDKYAINLDIVVGIMRDLLTSFICTRINAIKLQSIKDGSLIKTYY